MTFLLYRYITKLPNKVCADKKIALPILLRSLLEVFIYQIHIAVETDIAFPPNYVSNKRLYASQRKQLKQKVAKQFVCVAPGGHINIFGINGKFVFPCLTHRRRHCSMFSVQSQRIYYKRMSICRLSSLLCLQEEQTKFVRRLPMNPSQRNCCSQWRKGSAANVAKLQMFTEMF